jgi:tetratricopeptide (TPR) repeat protein
MQPYLRLSLVVFVLLGIISCFQSPEQQAIEFFRKANVEAQKGNSTKAIQLFSEAIDKNKKFADAYNNRGLIYQKTQEFEKALVDFNIALKLDPKYIDAYFNRAQILIEKRLPKAALADLLTVQKARPDSAYVYISLSNAYDSLGDSLNATLANNKALAINPKLAEAIANKGYFLVQKNYLDSAQIYFEKALKLNPKLDFALNNMAYILAEKGQLVAAQKYADAALRFQPNNPYYLNNQGFIYLQSKKYKEASQFLARALDLDTTNAYLYKNLGNLHLAQGDLYLANENFKKARTLHPKIPLDTSF